MPRGPCTGANEWMLHYIFGKRREECVEGCLRFNRYSRHNVPSPANGLRIRSKGRSKRGCRRACLLHPLVVRRFAPSSKGWPIAG